MRKLIKICGMRDAGNIKDVARLNPDLMGFIFYKKSPRYAGDVLDKEVLKQLPENIKKVGVFVDATAEEVFETAKKYHLDIVQLHGNEDPETVGQIAEKLPVLKAFGIDKDFDFSQIKDYEIENVEFLFDTKSSERGGSGLSFDRSLLDRYKGNKPYFISGGISPENFKDVFDIKDGRCMGLDLNSRFEQGPGIKDIELLKKVL